MSVPASSATHVAYVDESCGQAAGHILLLSACVLPYSACKAFSDEWQLVLDTAPAIPSFHMREARSRDKPHYKGWTALDVDLKVIALTEVVVKYRPEVFSVWLREDDYNDIVRPVSPPDMKQAYFCAFNAICQKVVEYHSELGYTTAIDFVFDEHGDAGNEAYIWFDAIRQVFTREKQTMVGHIQFCSDTRTLPLQAADLLAWRLRRKKEGASSLDPELASSMRLEELRRGETELDRRFMKSVAERNARIVRESGLDFSGRTSFYKEMKSQFAKEQRKNRL